MGYKTKSIKTIIIKKFGLIILLGIFSFSFSSLMAQPSGKWEGSIDVLSQQIGIEVIFSKNQNNLGGVLSIPSQNAFGLKLNSVEWEKPRLSFRVDTATTHLTFDGKLKNDSITGKFLQSGYEGSFHLTKKIKKEIPWVDQEVTFKSGDLTLAGTLSLPDSSGTFPGVVLVSGSGGQDRSENVGGFKVFDKLAAALLKSGIAVIRYDDRGTGESEGQDVMNYTTLELAKDAAAAFQEMNSNPRIDKNKSGIIGHSEGAIIAGEVARNNPEVDYILLMAGSAVCGDKLLLAQSESIMKAQGMDENYVKNITELNKKVYSRLMKEKVDWEKLKDELWQGFTRLKKKEELTAMDSATIKKQVNAQMNAMQKPWFRHFVKLNPIEIYKDVDVPAVAMFGGKDSQVPARQNARAIEEMGKDNFEIKLFQEANHLFQKAETGSPMEYGSLEKNFVGGFTEFISKWIKKR